MSDRDEIEQPPNVPFRWSERRVARFFTILVSAAVVLADIALFFVFRGNSSAFQAPWRSLIPFGIAGILLFALARLRRQVRLFREDR
jgi:ABC-type multidrug transport system permease subunit